MTTSPRGSLGDATLRHSSTIIQVSHSPFPITTSKSPGAASTPFDHQPQVLARASPSNIPQEVAWLQKEMNVALGQLLTMKATLDSHQSELERDLDSAMQECELRLPGPFKKQNPYALSLLKRWRPTMWLQSRRWKTAALLKSMPFNSHIEKTF